MITSIEQVREPGYKLGRDYIKADDIDTLKDGEYAIYRNALATCYNGCDQVVLMFNENDRLAAVLYSSNGQTKELINNKIKEYNLKV